MTTMYFDVTETHADEPQMNATYFMTAEQVKAAYPLLAATIPTAQGNFAFKLSLTVDLVEITIELATGHEAESTKAIVHEAFMTGYVTVLCSFVNSLAGYGFENPLQLPPATSNAEERIRQDEFKAINKRLKASPDFADIMAKSENW